jgi:septal ring factor EnvC (AmiA/AmiB activator)
MKILLSVMVGALFAATLLFLYNMHGSIARLETAQAASASALKQMDDRLDTEDSTMRAATGALAEKVGMTDQRLRQRTAELRREQKASDAHLKVHDQQIEGVRTEQQAQKQQLEGVRTDVAGNRTDLEATKAKLEKTIGDLGVQSGLIAHTREDLDQLKRRGDRNYYEFTLAKGRRPTRVSTIGLQLKKTNPKRGKFTLNVIADDWTIEKRDRTLFEPMQFYSGRERQLYEVVVMSVDKNKVSGYLSTPKQYGSAPQTQGQ